MAQSEEEVRRLIEGESQRLVIVCGERSGVLEQLAEDLKDLVCIIYSSHPGMAFYFQGRHITIDCGRGAPGDIDFSLAENDLVDVIECVYRAAKKGRPIAVSPKAYPIQV